MHEYILTYLHTYVRTYVHAHTHTYAYMFTFRCLHFNWLNMHEFTNMYVYNIICFFIFITVMYTYTYIQTHTHIRMQVNKYLSTQASQTCKHLKTSLRAGHKRARKWTCRAASLIIHACRYHRATRVSVRTCTSGPRVDVHNVEACC